MIDKTNVLHFDWMIAEMLTATPEDAAHADFQTELWVRLRQSDYRASVERIFEIIPYSIKERLDEQSDALFKKRGWEL